MVTSLADLHRHLDGSLRETTLHELAAHRKIVLPEALRFYDGMGLSDALARFQVTLSVLQAPHEVRRVAAEMCEDARLEGVDTLEIRFAPQLHRGAPVEDIVDAALMGIDDRAGLILCGLYGEDPAVMEALVDIGIRRRGVVGIDLAGGPSPKHTWSMTDYGHAFTTAREHGLGRTVHAGEGRPPSEIATAIKTLHAQRIGHGTTLIQDPRVVEMVLEHGVTLEACPTSNIHTGVISRLEDHPLRAWLDLGVAVCVCTDNTFFSDVDAPRELDAVAVAQGLSAAQVQQLVDYGHRAAFTTD